MYEFVYAAILGAVEGITEFLPISSTGHLLLTEQLMGHQQSEAFNVLIQVGPIVAVTLVFWRRIVELIKGFGDPLMRDESIKLIVCFVLTGIGGLLAKKSGAELPDTALPIAIATLVGAVVIFWAEARIKGKQLVESISWPVVVAVAAGQVLAGVFPGTSRSGAAVIAALLLGVSRPASVRFAFLVGIPTMFAAGAYELKGAIDAGQTAELITPASILAFVCATLTAWVAVVWLLRFVQTHTFKPFAWYRVALGAVMIAMIFFGVL